MILGRDKPFKATPKYLSINKQILFETFSVRVETRKTYRTCSYRHRDYKRIEAASGYKFSQARGSN